MCGSSQNASLNYRLLFLCQSGGPSAAKGYTVWSMAESTKVAYFRNFVFGVEDSLVSTVGLLSGVAIAGLAREEIFLTGVILIFVEAVSMAAGSFLSESSAEEFATHSEK